MTDSDGKTWGGSPGDMGCQPAFAFQTLSVLPVMLTGFSANENFSLCSRNLLGILKKYPLVPKWGPVPKAKLS